MPTKIEYISLGRKMKADQKRIDKGLYWDRAWSLVEGCSYVSEGCRNCWSASQASMRSKQSNPKIRERYSGVTDESGRWNGNIKFLHQNLILPSKVKKPQIWSIWNDLFHEGVGWSDIYKTFEMIYYNPQHIFLLLTKRPDRMFEELTGDLAFHLKRQSWCKQFPLPNLWLGVTAENQQTADERIPVLLQIPAKVRFVSVEPMLERVDISKFIFPMTELSWAICGAETSRGKRPMKTEWAISLRNQCEDAGVPFFFKKGSNGKRLLDGKLYEGYPNN